MNLIDKMNADLKRAMKAGEKDKVGIYRMVLSEIKKAAIDQGTRDDINDELVLAVDLNGQAGCRTVQSWDANSGKTAEELLFRLAALPLIADRKLCQAAKDVSNAGILGTTSIMLENSGKGGLIDLTSIPCPDGLALKDWLLCFQSFGFILSVNPRHTQAVIDVCAERNIIAAVIGRVIEEPVVRVKNGDEFGVLFDFNHEIITGITCPPTD